MAKSSLEKPTVADRAFFHEARRRLACCRCVEGRHSQGDAEGQVA
jgi:hypothetical protein